MIIQSPSIGSIVVPNVCGVALVHERDILLLKRAERKFGAGLWGIPAGKQEGSESVLTTAVRELKEETSVLLQKDELTFIEQFYVVPSVNPLGPFRFHLFTVHAPTKPIIIRSVKEHDEDRWVNLDDIERYTFVEDGLAVLQHCRSFWDQP